jgi:hypothetical protein
MARRLRSISWRGYRDRLALGADVPNPLPVRSEDNYEDRNAKVIGADAPMLARSGSSVAAGASAYLDVVAVLRRRTSRRIVDGWFYGRPSSWRSHSLQGRRKPAEPGARVLPIYEPKPALTPHAVRASPRARRSSILPAPHPWRPYRDVLGRPVNTRARSKWARSSPPPDGVANPRAADTGGRPDAPPSVRRTEQGAAPRVAAPSPNPVTGSDVNLS